MKKGVGIVESRRPDGSSRPNGPAPSRALRSAGALMSVVVLVGIVFGTIMSPRAKAQAPTLTPGTVITPVSPPPATSFYPQINALTPRPPAIDQRGASRLAYSPDGSTLAVGTPFGINLYAVTDPRTVRFIGFINTGTPVTSLAYSGDGDILASGSYTDTIILWDMRTSARYRSLAVPQGTINALAFAPDGATLASGSSDGLVRLWRVSDGQIQRTLQGHLGAVLSLSFSPDGAFVASGGADGTVRLWQLATGLSTSALVGNIGGVTSLAFSPDGTLLAIGSGDGTVRLWDVKTNRLAQTWTAHRGAVTALGFSPDGTWLASGAYDRIVLLRQVREGKIVNTLNGGGNGVVSLAFAPNGTALAVGALDGAVRIWAVANLVGRQATPQPTPIVVPVTPTPIRLVGTCTDVATFVADVTIPDNTPVAPGALFNKTWRLRNSGTCTWGIGYTLNFVGGNLLGAATSVPVALTPPGATVDITVAMYAPAVPGIYQGIWQLANPSRQFFGPRVTVLIQVPTPYLPPPPPVVNFNLSASATDINAGDSVTIRASVQGVRAAWVNGDPVVNNYYEKSFSLCGDTTYTLDVLMPDGSHQYRSVTVYVHGECHPPEPDLRIASLKANHTTVHVGDTVHFTAEVKNEDGREIKNFDLWWRPSSSASWIKVADDLDLDSDEKMTVTWDHTFTSAGTFKTEAWVNKESDADERDTDNNRKSLTITVKP